MAAVVFVPPSPHDPLQKMAATGRRAPLASIPNATNSPHRLLTNSGSKRSRSIANVSHQENEPPYKRQAVDRSALEPIATTPRRQSQVTLAEGKVFERGYGENASTAFQRKLVAARDKGTTSRMSRNVETTTKDDTIRQWQKHYRKLFPSFSFYFDSVTEDARARFVRQIVSLGAKEERFFSKSVTHIITTRSIPQDTDATRSIDVTSTRSTPTDEQPQTINPSLLEKNPFATRNTAGVNTRREGINIPDILARGRKMGMKIWAAEKLHRILASILEDTGSHSHHTRGSAHATRGHQDDLVQVLKNEKLGAASERDQANLAREMVSFKGPFIYVHDMEEKYRPTMVREYPKVARRQDGEWPQFRSASIGKCPFVEDPAMKREMEQERARQRQFYAQASKETSHHTRARSTTAEDGSMMNPPQRGSPRKALREVRNALVQPATVDPIMLQKAPIASSHERQLSFPPMPDQANFEFIKPNHMQLGREPAASGIQRSNLTSAIQSQMISSTAAAGVKAGTSREVHELKRKVLERSHTGSLSVGSIPSSHRMTDLVGALKNSRAPAPQRAAKSKAQEKLGGIQEEVDPNGVDESNEKTVQGAAVKRKKPAQRDPKPGYCENCRDKYDDFEEHIISRKHRKFAMTQSNWTDLDDLLAKLQCP